MKPQILRSMTRQLVERGKTHEEADTIAREHLTKHGILRPGTDQLTYYGSTRNSMGSKRRADDRRK
jgi:hypothetical protein